MILTEEQKRALKRVVAYMDEMYAIASPYHGCTEDVDLLRAMIDSSGTVEPVGGFDLEKGRAVDEALPYPLDAKEIWVSNRGQMHINPPNEPSIFFTLSDLCEFRNIFHGQAAEIERLRASLIDLHAEYINTLEKNPECSAWDLDEQSDADQKRLRRNAAHAISIVEPPIYLQAEQRATKIKELEDALVDELVKQQFWCGVVPSIDERQMVARRMLQAEGKIGPDATKTVYQTPISAENPQKMDVNHQKTAFWQKTYPTHAKRDEILNAPANGKIGPDADAKPHCWQITEERVRAIRLSEELAWDCKVGDVLRAMLEEAEQ